jgi:hypothetical protein
MCAAEEVSSPFAVINADDFYGKDGFVKAFQFLTTDCSENVYGLIGYELSKTLSANGSVSRGVCEVDGSNNLVAINERLKLYRDGEGMVYEEGDGSKHPVPEDAKGSMNFWCFHPSLFPFLQEEFNAFLDANIGDPKAEFLIPLTADRFIKSGRGVIKVLPTTAQWFGVTYKEDAPVVTKSIKDLVDSGAYPAKLWP